MEFSFDAVVLAGGRASRLGGVDKTALTVGGATLLERAVSATAGAERVVIVSGRADRSFSSARRAVLSAAEEPPFSGPASALAAGLAVLGNARRSSSHRPDWTLVLAADVPRVGEAVAALRPEAEMLVSQGEWDGIVATDDSGRRQPLLAWYRTSRLAASLDDHDIAGDLVGLSLRRLLAPLRLAEVAVSSELSADVDSPADAIRLGVNPVENASDDSRAAD